MVDGRSNIPMFRNNGPFKVVISIITLWSFLFSIFAYDIAWAAGTPSGPATVGSDRAGGPGAFKLPHHLGEVKQESAPAHRLTGSPANRQTIIHIQDAHCDYACQHAIKEIVELEELDCKKETFADEKIKLNEYAAYLTSLRA